jgi:hypothetical protein
VSDTNPFDPAKTKAAVAAELDALEQLPANTVRGGLVAEHGDVGAVIEGHVDPGKPGGAFVAGEAVWWKKAGWKVAAMVGWTKSPPAGS